jgi:hypothetical protein
MIRNLLYSIFLHSILIAVVYLNFNIHKPQQAKTSEIAVTLMSLDGDEKTGNPAPATPKQEEKPKDEKAKEVEESKPAESPKPSEKDEIKKTPKKIAKTKVLKEIKKQPIPQKNEEFRQQQNEETKQIDAKKPQEEKVQNQNEDKEENEITKKEESSQAKKQSEKNSEQKIKQSAKQQEVIDMANSLENLDLSGREKYNIETQLKFCYRMALNESKFDGKIKIMAAVQIGKDGKITFDLEKTVDKNRYDNADEANYRKMISNIERALDLCSPLRNLPVDKYDIWKEVVLEFGE